MPSTTQQSLTELTKQVTAFPTFAKLAEAMDGGYVPSMLTAAGKRNAARNEMVTELADRLEGLGYRVWRG